MMEPRISMFGAARSTQILVAGAVASCLEVWAAFKAGNNPNFGAYIAHWEIFND